ncbi:hypothetical protein ASD39_22970 [Sphingomonas sp. Root50]|nr:hypothetical protein ASD17_19070 [Sphingomonas sp. Root1294]KQY70735.1 hypothetical protein ASD39_22970 [Sphingomonas sp. Root50]KRB91772.1 hypothetical protein ASE22_07340 [Sphingomonas sp. Root720]
MEKRTPSHMTSQARLRPSRTVQAPQRYEGIGNALRLAYGPDSYGLPDEMMGLLSKLDAK